MELYAVLWYIILMKATQNKQNAFDPMARIAFLEQQLQEQQSLVNSLKEKLQSQEDYIANLTEMLVKAQKTIFGQSSEKHCYQKQDEPLQLTLFNEAVAQAQTDVAPLVEAVTVSGHCMPCCTRPCCQKPSSMPTKQRCMYLNRRRDHTLIRQQVVDRMLLFLKPLNRS